MKSTGLGGAQYIVLRKDEFSSYRQVAFASSKSEIAHHVKRFTTAELETGNRCPKIVSNGSEFVNATLKSFMVERGIIHDQSAFYVPEQNGLRERDFCLVAKATRSMLLESKLDRTLWTKAIACAVYVLNRTTRNEKTPYEKWHNQKPSVNSSHVFCE